MSQKKKNNIIIASLCAVVLLMVVGYAAFQSILNITGTTRVSSNWQILITKIDTKNIVGGASNASDPTGVGTLTAKFNTNLVSPGDSIEYHITVTNGGSLNAVLEKITLSDPDNEAIKFTATGLTEGETLSAGGSATLTVKVEYLNSVTTQPNNLKSEFNVQLDYVQEGTLNGGSLEIPDNGEVYSWSTKSVKPGDSVKTIEGVTADYKTLDKNHFIKHVIVDGNVASSEACFIKNNNLYCLKPSEYENNKTTLLDIFGSSACDINTSRILCSDSFGAVYADKSVITVDINARVCNTYISTASWGSSCYVNG